MKHALIFTMTIMLFGCATKSDVKNIQTQINTVKSDNLLIETQLDDSFLYSKKADSTFITATYYNTRALDSWEEISKKLDKIIKKK